MTAQATVHELRTGALPLATTQQAQPVITVGFDTLAGFELTQRVATMFSKSSLMPKDFVGNVANCAIALNMAARMGADPLMVAQNLYVVHGRPGWSAQFLIATFNACGRFSAIRYEFEGREGSDEWKCRAWSTEKATSERIEGAWVSIAIAKAEGWYGKNGSKWQTMPQQMLQYRAASWMIRAYAPEIAMGLQTVEEVRDTWDMAEEAPGVYAMTTDEIRPEPKQVDAAPTTIDLSPQPEPEKAANPKATAKPKEQAEPASILCPNDPDEDGNPQAVYMAMCESCQQRPHCPSW